MGKGQAASILILAVGAVLSVPTGGVSIASQGALAGITIGALPPGAVMPGGQVRSG